MTWEGGWPRMRGSAPGLRILRRQGSTLNAFALPGGYIGVHTGLLLGGNRASRNWPGCCSHEIAHVEQHHIRRMVGKQGQANLTSLAALVVAILAAGSKPRWPRRTRHRYGRQHADPTQLHARIRARGRSHRHADPGILGLRGAGHGVLLRPAAAVRPDSTRTTPRPICEPTRSLPSASPTWKIALPPGRNDRYRIRSPFNWSAPSSGASRACPPMRSPISKRSCAIRSMGPRPPCATVWRGRSCGPRTTGSGTRGRGAAAAE